MKLSQTSFSKTLKKHKLCPVCTIRRLQSAAGVHVEGVGFENGAAPTPPMGWSSWNLFGRNVNERVILETAKAIKAAHLDELGYVYVNVDDCWMASVRDAEGRLQSDPVTFPSGIKALAKEVNALGLKLGLYTSNGTETCEDLPSSLYHERTDAETFADWGIEYFKYDFCHNKPIPTAGPELRAVSLSRPGTDEIVLEAAKAELRGTAEVLTDDRLSGDGAYVAGLDSGNGAVIFYDVEVPEAGDYTLTLHLRKWGYFRKYAEVEVDAKDIYPVTIPPTRGGSHDGKAHVTVTLPAGKVNIRVRNPVGSFADSAAKQYRAMGLELQRAAKLTAEKEGREPKPICFSICEWGLNRPWKWGATAGNLWRTTPDIRPTWASVLSIYERNVLLSKYAGPGHWNDPDMLEVGNGNLTDNENTAHFSLWCMMAAPLILGNDVRTFLLPDGRPDLSNKTLRIIANKQAISINQDPLGKQCVRIKAGLCDVLIKPLANKELAVCLFNKTTASKEAAFSLAQIANRGDVDLPKSDRYTVYDVWENTTFVSNGEIGEKVAGRSVKLYRIKAMA